MSRPRALDRRAGPAGAAARASRCSAGLALSPSIEGSDLSLKLLRGGREHAGATPRAVPAQGVAVHKGDCGHVGPVLSQVSDAEKIIHGEPD